MKLIVTYLHDTPVLILGESLSVPLLKYVCMQLFECGLVLQSVGMLLHNESKVVPFPLLSLAFICHLGDWFD